ncbi:MAG TPA: hypothetical protein VHW67_04225 [Solirubrobacteraceae bacterium]|jgi:hypothetical protein|nr:hypothetical protein [Solirubrobacteraceae bacterium]
MTAREPELGSRVHVQASHLSTESIASPSPAAVTAPPCAGCGAPLADDQRYCLQCGERVGSMSSVLLAGSPQQDVASRAADAQAAGAQAAGAQAAGPGPAATAPLGPGATPPGFAPAGAGQAGGAGRNNGVTVIAAVGVLLLAMGIGVLIGRAGGSRPSASAAPQVISVSSAPSDAGTSSSGAEEAAAFTDDWPAGAKGYTVQLQTLALAGTQAGAVESAKSAAEGKGAKQVGALKSEDFAGLAGGNYVVYSGKYAKQAEAQKALGGLKRSFPSASVIHITGAAGGSAAKGSTPSAPAGGKSGAGTGESNPAPPKVLEDLHKSKGKSYEEKSKNLPDVVGT